MSIIKNKRSRKAVFTTWYNKRVIHKKILKKKIETILGTQGGNTYPTVSGVTISPETFTLIVGDAPQSLSATVAGTNNPPQGVSWQSSNTNLATVDSSGNVTAIAEGSVTITAYSLYNPTKFGTSAGTISAGTIESVSVSPATFTLTVGDSPQQLTATVTGTGNYSEIVNWTTSNANIATVNSSGQVTAVGAGSVTITATSAQDGTKTDTSAGTISAAIDTRPRWGYSTAFPTTSLADIFAALTNIGGSNGSRVLGSVGSPINVAPTNGNYTWFACLASGAPAGVVFNTSFGPEEWAGAASAGQFAGNEPIQTPTTTHQEYTDANNNVWHLFRQNLTNISASVWMS